MEEMSMKKICTLFTVIIAAAMLSGCQVTGECEKCGKTAPLYRTWLNLGDESSENLYCEDCANEWLSAIKTIVSLAVDDPDSAEGSVYGMEKYTG